MGALKKVPWFRETPKMQVTGPSLSRDMRILWEKGTCSDVQLLDSGYCMMFHVWGALCLRAFNFTQPELQTFLRLLQAQPRFMIQGEVINAHSPVLCARSEVFEAQLTTGMKESVSKVIEITDCDLATFKAFLQFIYTDNLASADELCSSSWVSVKNVCHF